MQIQMQAYNRLPSSGHTTPSPPQSPSVRSPRYRHGRSKQGRPGPPPPRTMAHRLAYLVLSVLLRRQGIFLFAPLIYISGMLFYMGTVSFDVGPVISHHPAPGEIEKEKEIWSQFLLLMISTIWKNSYKGGEWRPCVNKSTPGGLADSNGYIYVEANGGLNQQRASICNAVAVAGYLNATLVIPNFHYHSIWRDPSKFNDIYDEEYFMSMLQNHVRVVNMIPDYLMARYDHNMSNVYNFRIKAWSTIQYYKDNVHPKLLEEKVDAIVGLGASDVTGENKYLEEDSRVAGVAVKDC
uniref:O-fucosyltransferase family protein n=1 Tax=Chenopodium quinoa TaxID=63459 RepID=A0A803LJN3_CHEQI